MLQGATHWRLQEMVGLDTVMKILLFLSAMILTIALAQKFYSVIMVDGMIILQPVLKQ